MDAHFAAIQGGKRKILTSEYFQIPRGSIRTRRLTKLAQEPSPPRRCATKTKPSREPIGTFLLDEFTWRANGYLSSNAKVLNYKGLVFGTPIAFLTAAGRSIK
jgi:hypothetical protein